MLQAIREKAQGWIAWAIVILISIPFALWGIQEYLGVGGEPEVAVVEGEKITERMLDQRVRDVRESMRASLGDAFAGDLFNDAAFKKQVLDAMVEELVLAKHAQDWNLRTGDAQARGFIGAIPAFQRDGRFDQAAYETAVRNRGMSRAGFEQSVRQDLALGQLRNGIRDTAFVTKAELETSTRLREQTRDLRFVRVPAADYRDQVGIDAQQLRAFYDANLDRYRTPERVKLDYVLLDAAGLSGLVGVDEDTLRRYFEDHRAEFVAREEREMRHILVTVPAGADDAQLAEARSRAEELLEQVRAGADFAEMAREHSDDPGSAANGGDLGWVERGVMVPAFEEAGFALPPGEVSDLVRTDFGFHIIQVTDSRGGSDAGFDELRDQIEAAYRKFEAENLYFDYAERLAESAYENPASLMPAAEALGLEIKTTDWATRDGQLPAPLESPRVINAAFADDVLIEGHNSELIEVGAQRAIVVRVAQHEPAGFESFEDNRAAIEQDYVQHNASEAAAEAGKALLSALEAGESRLESAAESHSWPLETREQVGRIDTSVPAEVLAEAFDLAPPASGDSAFAGVVSAEGDYFVIEVTAVRDGGVDADTAAPTDGEQLRSIKGNAQLQYVVQSLRERSDITTKPIGE